MRLLASAFIVDAKNFQFYLHWQDMVHQRGAKKNSKSKKILVEYRLLPYRTQTIFYKHGHFTFRVP